MRHCSECLRVLGHHGAMAAPLLLFQCHTGVPLALSVPALPICRHSAIRHSAPSDHLRHRVWNLFSSGIHRNGAVLPNVQERWSKSFVYVWILFRHCQRYTASRLWLQLDTEDLCLLRTIAWVRHRSIGHVRHVTRFLFSTGRSRFEDDASRMQSLSPLAMSPIPILA